MTKYEFYSMASRIFYTFDNNDGKISNFVPKRGKHIDYIIESIPSRLYSLDKTTASIACFYVNFRYSPSSHSRMFEKLKEIENKEIAKFKEYLQHSLRTYKSEFKEINSKLFKMDASEAINAYKRKEINFITLYYFIKKNKLEKEIRSSSIYSIIFSKIEPLILFLKTSKTINLEEPC